jgi:guanosine-3',5'-bis(diphosphate) 3'-pyrophosphohydrolase
MAPDLLWNVMNKSLDTNLPAVLAFAFRAHGDQQRKFEQGPYIIHPVRVMQICKEYTNDQKILAAALLHDVLEDTETKEGEMRDFLGKLFSQTDAAHIFQLVDELTDKYSSREYPGLNREQRKNKEALRMETCHPDTHTIKYADIIDNSITITSADGDFVEKYLQECRQLLRKIDKGNPQLYERVVSTVDKLLSPGHK